MTEYNMNSWNYYRIYDYKFYPELNCKSCRGKGLVAPPMSSFSFAEVYCQCIMLQVKENKEKIELIKNELSNL